MNTTISAKTLLYTQWTDFYGWKKVEYVWLISASAAIIAISMIMGSSMLEIVSALTGVIGAILVAKAKISSYVWGVIATATYAWIAFQYQLYGEAILYTILFLPMQFIGYYVWIKAAKKERSAEIVDVKRRLLTGRQRLYVGAGTIAVIAAYAVFIGLLRGATPGLDSATAILSVLATFLMVLRYGEQWIAWIAVNIVAIIMWTIMVIHHEDQGWAVLAMWVLYLLNAVYGWIKWRKGTIEKIIK